jgi:endonuclease YncB( thermonuclease family)
MEVSMKITGLLLATTLVTGVAIAGESRVDPQSVEIEDADTLLVEVDGSRYRVQLVGIDAPESARNPKLQRDVERTGLAAGRLLALGARADAGLRELLPSFRPYRLVFEPASADRYGRVPGDLLDATGRRLSERLVSAGLALPLPGADGKVDPALAAAADGARDAQWGLWSGDPQAFAAWADLER